LILDPRFERAWDAYMERAGQPFEEVYGRYQQQFRAGHCKHDEVVFPPAIFSKAFLDGLAAAAKRLLALVESIPGRFFDGSLRDWARFQCLPEREALLLMVVASPRSLSMATHFARPDCLATKEGFKVVEVNIAPPIGGMDSCDRIAREFMKTGYFSYLTSAGAILESKNTARHWLEALRRLSRVANAADHPVLFEALANPDEDIALEPDHPEFVRILEEGGFQVRSGYVQDLRVAEDGVFDGGVRVHSVFTMFTWSEYKRFVAPEHVIALAAADESGLVDFIAPPTSALFDSKTNLELLTSPEWSDFLSGEERAFLHSCLPTTFRVLPGRTERAFEQQESLVLKPAGEFGGRGILVGAQTSRDTWRGEVTKAAEIPGSFVCQETISDLFELSVRRGSADPVRQVMCLGPMLFGREYAGTFVRQIERQSGVPIINAARGATVGTGFCAL
jgi:hypothetical protein